MYLVEAALFIPLGLILASTGTDAQYKERAIAGASDTTQEGQMGGRGGKLQRHRVGYPAINLW